MIFFPRFSSLLNETFNAIRSISGDVVEGISKRWTVERNVQVEDFKQLSSDLINWFTEPECTEFVLAMGEPAVVY